MTRVNVDRIKGRTRELRLTDNQVAEKLGIHPSTYYRKLNEECGDTFTVAQILKLSSILCFTKSEAADIFFADELA